jgi:hypothetical protein
MNRRTAKPILRSVHVAAVLRSQTWDTPGPAVEGGGRQRSVSTKKPAAAALIVVFALALLTGSAALGETLHQANAKEQLDPAIVAAMVAHAHGRSDQHSSAAIGASVSADRKNEWPFTRLVAAAGHSTASTAPATVDPKNEWPFDRRVAGLKPQATTPNPSPDSKNEWPFTRHLAQIAGNGSSGTEGFSWTDSGIGLFAGIGVALTAAAAAALMLTRKTRHPRTT